MPDGEFPGTIMTSKLIQEMRNGKLVESVRLTLAADPLPDAPFNDYRARVDYYESQSHELIRDAHLLLGPDVIKLRDPNGDLIPENLHLLEGKRVMFRVVHEHKPKHDTPYRKVVGLKPHNPEGGRKTV